jgi:hypothetical protein
MDSMSSLWIGTCATLTVIVLSAFAIAAYAGSVTFADVCTPARYVQRGSDLLIYCPGEAQPWLTFKGCPKARVTWDRTKTKVTIVCAA